MRRSSHVVGFFLVFLILIFFLLEEGKANVDVRGGDGRANVRAGGKLSESSVSVVDWTPPRMDGCGLLRTELLGIGRAAWEAGAAGDWGAAQKANAPDGR